MLIYVGSYKKIQSHDIKDATMVTRKNRLENLTNHSQYEQLKDILSRLTTMRIVVLSMVLVFISGVIGSRDEYIIIGGTLLAIAGVMTKYYMGKFDKIESSVTIETSDTTIKDTENPHNP